MGVSLIGPIWLLLLVVALVGTIGWSVRNKSYASLSWRGVVTPALPGVIMVSMFYALALHMHGTLGGWPKAIGEAGFPPGLITHAEWTVWYFEAMILTVLFAWPVALVVCSLIPRLRRIIAHLSLFAASSALCFGLMLLGPSQFLYWWWD